LCWRWKVLKAGPSSSLAIRPNLADCQKILAPTLLQLGIKADRPNAWISEFDSLNVLVKLLPSAEDSPKKAFMSLCGSSSIDSQSPLMIAHTD
jgi:hypothetical protein